MSARKTLLNIKRPDSPSPRNAKSHRSVTPKIKTKHKEEEEFKMIEELSEEVFKNNKDLIKNISSGMNFSNAKFQLNSLDNILKFPKLKPDKIFVIDVSNNKLHSIDVLNCFPNLKNLIASNNLIKEVNLKLNFLEELILSNNQLQEVYLFIKNINIFYYLF